MGAVGRRLREFGFLSDPGFVRPLDFHFGIEGETTADCFILGAEFFNPERRTRTIFCGVDGQYLFACLQLFNRQRRKPPILTHILRGFCHSQQIQSIKIIP
jgi:hypothetical protein